jgi:Icc-related predicted phosphoesterase
MRLLVLSDLHVEFAPFVPDPTIVEQADVIVLAGDIHSGAEGMAWARSSFGAKSIIYVAGNHEFYGRHWDGHIFELQKQAKRYGIHFLEDDSVEIGGHTFFGSTLWTDFEFFGKSRYLPAMEYAQQALNDFRLIASGGELLHPAKTVERHNVSLFKLSAALYGCRPSKTVVISHHCPHENSVAPRWKDDLLTAGFCSNIDPGIIAKAGLWIHGHTHDSYDYVVDGVNRKTRIVCNPRGYPLNRSTGQFENPKFNSELLIEI